MSYRLPRIPAKVLFALDSKFCEFSATVVGVGAGVHFRALVGGPVMCWLYANTVMTIAGTFVGLVTVVLIGLSVHAFVEFAPPTAATPPEPMEIAKTRSTIRCAEATIPVDLMVHPVQAVVHPLGDDVALRVNVPRPSEYGPPATFEQALDTAGSLAAECKLCPLSNPLSAIKKAAICSSLLAASITDDPDIFSTVVTAAVNMITISMAMAMLAAPF